MRNFDRLRFNSQLAQRSILNYLSYFCKISEHNCMKSQFYLCFFLLVFVVSCVDRDIPNMNGMWQLKTIEGVDNSIRPVDTIYYSFQRQRIFSYTILKTNEIGHEEAWVAYGYVDYPDSERMRIVMDKAYEGAISALLWKDMEVEYEILHLGSKKMVLGYQGERYSFVKF